MRKIIIIIIMIVIIIIINIMMIMMTIIKIIIIIMIIIYKSILRTASLPMVQGLLKGKERGRWNKIAKLYL